MSPHPASPSSLLWANQLKREHTHLLHRIKDVETIKSDIEERLRSQETTIAALDDVRATTKILSAKVHAIEEASEEQNTRINQLSEQFSQLQEQMLSSHNDVLKELKQRMGDLERKKREFEDENIHRRMEYQKLLDRIGALEENMQKETLLRQELVKKTGSLNIATSKQGITDVNNTQESTQRLMLLTSNRSETLETRRKTSLVPELHPWSSVSPCPTSSSKRGKHSDYVSESFLASDASDDSIALTEILQQLQPRYIFRVFLRFCQIR
jgi:chromosome segregation ATPase